MTQSHVGWRTGYRRAMIYMVIAMLLAGIVAILNEQKAHAAACITPPVDNGTVTHTVSVDEAGTYRVWTRMAAPNSSASTYYLEVNSNDCYEVGGSSVPVYANPSGPYFVSGTSNWTSRTSGGAYVDVTLSAGDHQLKLIGAHADVVVDRIILTRDTVCVPSGVGDNCATEFKVVDINEDGAINYLDLSALASRYGQSGGSVGRSDINRDGTVNFQDFSLLAAGYEV